MKDGSAVATGAESAPLPGPRTEYARLLRAIDLFASLDRVTLAKLAAHLQPQRYTAGTTIFRQGDVGDAFYLVAAGTVGVYATEKTSGIERQVRLLNPGEPFGEMALLSNVARTASIKVETDCEVLRLERGEFLKLVQDQPSVALAIAGTLSRRLAGMLTPSQGDRSGSEPASKVGDGGEEVVRALPLKFSFANLSLWRPTQAGYAFIASAAVFLLGWLLPQPSGLSTPAWHALISLIAILPPLVTDALMEGVIALLLACIWVVTGAANTRLALSGFASTSWVLVVAVLIIGAAITQTGILYRLSLLMITRLRGGFVGEVLVLSCAGQLMGPAVPNATSRIIIIAPMLRELVDALGYAARSKPAVGLSMAVLIGFGQMAATTLTSSTTSVLVSAVLPAPVRADVTWIMWTVYAAPMSVTLFAGLIGTIVWYYRPAGSTKQHSSDRARLLDLQFALLGPMSRDEKIALTVGIALLAGFVSQPLHHLDAGWVAVLAVGVLSAARVVTVATLRNVNWNFALLFGILISLAAVFSDTGLDKWIAGQVAASMGSMAQSRIAFVVALSILCFLISFVVRWQAAAPLVTIALSPVAASAGIHPYIVGLIAVVACNGFFLPYQSTTYLALDAGTGKALFKHADTLPVSIGYAVWTTIAVVVSVPIWHLMGLM
jgi:anion transporter